MQILPESTLAAKFVIKTHYIMRVIEFHPEDQTVDLIQDVFEFCNTTFGQETIVNDFGNEITVCVQKPDIMYGIPVKQERWGQFEIQCCPKKGDTGYIEVFTNDIRDWMINGSRNVPLTDAHFLKQSCVFVPFIPNAVNASTDYPANPDGTADNTKLVIKSANAYIKITDTSEETSEGSEPTVDIETSAQTLNINAEKGITVTGDINITGDITVTGTITADGNIESTNGDVIASGISLKNHKHSFTVETTGTATAQTGTTEKAQ